MIFFRNRFCNFANVKKKQQQKEKKKRKLLRTLLSDIFDLKPDRKETEKLFVMFPWTLTGTSRRRGYKRWEISRSLTMVLENSTRVITIGVTGKFAITSGVVARNWSYPRCTRPYRLFVYPTRTHNRRWRGHLSIARLLSLYDFQIFTSEILAAKHIVPPPRFLQTAKPGKQSRINRISVTLLFSISWLIGSA